MNANPDFYGLLAQLPGEQELVQATHSVYAAGYRRFDAFAPYPVEELAEAMNFRHTRVPMLVLIGGLIGGISGFGLQYWINVFSYPLNIGGRPHNSWPAFIPVTFELTVLVAGLFAVLGMLALNGLPQPYHPLFNVERFSLATEDGFFLCIEAADTQFDDDQTRQLLQELGATEVFDVPA